MFEKVVFQFESEEIDIKSIVHKYARYWYFFVFSIILCVSIAFTYVRYATPAYSISSLLLIKDDKKGPDLSGNAVFSDLEFLKSSKNIENEIQVLKSKSLMQRVLAELSLHASYFVKGNIKTSEVYGRDLPVRVIVNELDSAAYDNTLTLYTKGDNTFELALDEGPERATHSFGQEVKTAYGTFTVEKTGYPFRREEITIQFHDLRKLAEHYNRELLVEPVNKEASVLTISLTEPVPEKGKDIINKLIEVYNKEAVEDKNQVASSTIEFIDERLAFLTTELTEVEKLVEEYKRENELTDVSSEAQLYLQRASEYNKQLAEFEIQLDVLNSIESYLETQQKDQFEVVPSTLTIQDPTLHSLITKFNELQLERQRMLRTTKPGNPLVQNMSDQLANLKANILENLNNIRSGLLITRNNLKANSSQFESRIQQVPTVERELLVINRQQGIKEGLYLYLLQKREEAALSLAASVSNSRVIDPAMTSDLPVSPKKPIVYLVALFLGLGFPFCLIYLISIFDDKVQSLQDVKQATQTPILGEISHSESAEKLVVTENSRTTVTELFRLIRANLQFSAAGKENKVILITSSMSGEGKTFFCINLGASLALTGKKVVLVNFDLRKPRLMQDMGLANEMGITNFLVNDKLGIEDILIPSHVVPGLYAIGAGPIPPNPAELMLSPKVKFLLDELKDQFDYVLIDTAPVGQVADTFTLAPYADSSIFLIRYGFTHKLQVGIIDDIHRNKKLTSPMIVLNDANKADAYGYGYSYGYGYVEREKRSWKTRLKNKVGA